MKGKLWWFLKAILSFFVILLTGLVLPMKSYAKEFEYIIEQTTEADFYSDVDAETDISEEESVGFESSFVIDENGDSEDSLYFEALLLRFENVYREIEDKISREILSEDSNGFMRSLGIMALITLLAQAMFIAFSQEKTVKTEISEESLEIKRNNESDINPSFIMPALRHEHFQAAITELNIKVKDESVNRTTPVLFAVEKIRRWIVTKSTLF